MAKKTQGEQLWEDYTSGYFRDTILIKVFCVQATEAELNRKAQERAANALERIADELEKPRDVINTLDDGA